MKYKDENKNDCFEVFTFEIVYFSTITDQIQIEGKVLTDKIHLFSFEMCPHFQNAG